MKQEGGVEGVRKGRRKGEEGKRNGRKKTRTGENSTSTYTFHVYILCHALRPNIGAHWTHIHTSTNRAQTHTTSYRYILLCIYTYMYTLNLLKFP